MRSLSCSFFLLQTVLVFCSVSVAQTNSNDEDWIDTETLRSMIFIKSDQEIHFVPNGNDPELKETQVFKLQSGTFSSPHFRQIKKAVGDRRIDLAPNPDVSAGLLVDLAKLFVDPKHKLNFRDLYKDLKEDQDDFGPFDSLPSPEIPEKISRLREAFVELTSDSRLPERLSEPTMGANADVDVKSLRETFAVLFDERQKLQIQKIDAQINKLKRLRARIEERAKRKDKEVAGMLNDFLDESTDSSNADLHVPDIRSR